MKITNRAFTCFATSMLVASTQAEPLTHEKLLEMQKNSAAAQNPHVSEVAKYKRSTEIGLAESSDFLCNGTIWTIIPKNSIINLPDRLKSKVLAMPKGKFVPWDEFLLKNPAWLTTAKVDLATSSGESKVDENRLLQFRQTGKIVVAVLEKSPISVTPEALKTEE